GSVAKVLAFISCTDENRLPRHRDRPTPIWRPEHVLRTRDIGLNRLELRTPDRGELSEFDDPTALKLKRGVLAPYIADAIREPLRPHRNDPCRARLTAALRPFQHRHMIGLAARLHNTGNRGDEPCWSDSGKILRV